MTEPTTLTPPNGRAKLAALPSEAGYQSLTEAQQAEMTRGALTQLESKHFGIALEITANPALTEAQRKELRKQQTDLMTGIRRLRSEYAALLTADPVASE
jgi:hypothetical protein